MIATPPESPTATDDGSEEPWYVYDRDQQLLRVTASLAEAEAWAMRHWEVVEVAGREQVENNDYWYLLFAAPDETGSASRDFQARIARRDRIIAMGRNPDTSPRFPTGHTHLDSPSDGTRPQ